MRTRPTVVVLALMAAGTAVRAGDSAPDLAAVVAQAEAEARADAQACDALVAADDASGWARARDQLLERVLAAVGRIERAAVASAAGDAPSPALRGAVDATDHLTHFRLTYALATARASAHADAAERALAFAGLREAAGGAMRAFDPDHAPVRTTPPAAREGVASSLEHLRVLLRYYIAGGAGVERPWPAFSGKAFLLWVVAANRLDRRDAKALALLFSPGDASRSLDRVGVAAYEGVTLAALRAGLDVSGLTSYVGRRNREKEHVLTAAELERGAAVIADLSFPDVALVGYANGSVRALGRAELGLGADDPIVAGDASKSPLLRALGE